MDKKFRPIATIKATAMMTASTACFIYQYKFTKKTF